MPKFQKGFAPIVVILGILLISSGIIGGAYYFKTQTQKPIDKQTNLPQPALMPSPQADQTQVDETENPDSTGANWKTYTNTKYNYAIQYPNDWIIEETDLPKDRPTIKNVVNMGKGSSHGYTWGGWTISIIVTPIPEADEGTITDSVYITDDASRFLGRVYINGAFGEQWSYGDPEFGGFDGRGAHAIFFIRNGMRYILVRYNGGDKDYQRQVEQVLPTFKFLDEE